MIHFFAPATGFALTAFPEARGFLAASANAFAAVVARDISIKDKKARCPEEEDEEEEDEEEDEEDEEEDGLDKTRSCHRSRNSV
jgi:hypothetical protein